MKNKYKVHDIAKKLNLKKHIIRHWEKEFQFSGANDYSQADFNIFENIKNLIYEKKLSINDVKMELEAILPKPKSQAELHLSKENFETFQDKNNEIETEEIENPTEIEAEPLLETKELTKEIIEEKSIIASHETTIAEDGSPEQTITASKLSEKPDHFFNHLELLKENLLKLKEKLN